MKICIVGGGPAGLTAGYMLAKKGHRVSVYESAEEPGGLAGTFLAGERKLEQFYHHLFTSDGRIIGLMDELGLAGRLKWFEPRNGFYLNGRLHPFTAPADLLRFRELPFWARVSMGMLVYKARFVKDWRRLENMTAREWIVKNAGRAVYENVWGPLLKAKFDRDADDVSAVWIWNKFKLRGSTRGKNLGRELLGYPDGSFGELCDRLAVRIRDMGGEVLCSMDVKGIAPKPDGTLDVVAGGGSENFEKVIVTTAPEILRGMGLPFPKEYIERLDALKYKSNICMVLELSAQLSPYYWITVGEKDSPFVVVVEHTNLTGTAGYNSHIAYLSRYTDANDSLYTADDDIVRERFFKYLKRMFFAWRESHVLRVHLYRARYAQPVVFRDYSRMMPGFATPVDNLYLASMAQVYPEDRGLNYAVRMGEEIAKEVVECR